MVYKSPWSNCRRRQSNTLLLGDPNTTTKAYIFSYLVHNTNDNSDTERFFDKDIYFVYPQTIEITTLGPIGTSTQQYTVVCSTTNSNDCKNNMMGLPLQLDPNNQLTAIKIMYDDATSDFTRRNIDKSVEQIIKDHYNQPPS